MTPKLTLGKDWSADLITGEGNDGPKYGDLGLYYRGENILPLGIDHYEVRFDEHAAKVYPRLKQVIDELNARDQWQPIATAPRDGTWILLAGPSGYTTPSIRVEVGHWYPEYRPLNPWQTHSNDAFTDGGPEPTHWMPLPEVP